MTIIEILDTSVNEATWKPTIQGVQPSQPNGWQEGAWLYLGATATPVGQWYYQLVHTFHWAGEGFAFPEGTANFDDFGRNSFHKYGWRYYDDVTEDVEFKNAAGAVIKTEKRVIRYYQTDDTWSQLYDIAGQYNVITGFDLTEYRFADLEL